MIQLLQSQGRQEPDTVGTDYRFKKVLDRGTAKCYNRYSKKGRYKW